MIITAGLIRFASTRLYAGRGIASTSADLPKQWRARRLRRSQGASDALRVRASTPRIGYSLTSLPLSLFRVMFDVVSGQVRVSPCALRRLGSRQLLVESDLVARASGRYRSTSPSNVYKPSARCLSWCDIVRLSSLAIRSRPGRSLHVVRGTHVEGLVRVLPGLSLNNEPLRRLAVAFARDAAHASNARLCALCAEVVGVTAAGITLMGGENAGPICVSSPQVKALEDLQFTIGQGPCRDAFYSGQPVHAARLDAAASDRWPPFVDLAKTSGIGAVFADPLLSSNARIGVLTLYQDNEGDLTAVQHDDSVALADVVAETLLSLQDASPTGMLAPSLEGAVAYRAEIYQASGMVAIQLQIPAAEALLRLRAHAFANDQTLSAVAADIVARRLRLDDDHNEPEHQL